MGGGYGGLQRTGARAEGGEVDCLARHGTLPREQGWGASQRQTRGATRRAPDEGVLPKMDMADPSLYSTRRNDLSMTWSKPKYGKVLVVT